MDEVVLYYSLIDKYGKLTSPKERPDWTIPITELREFLEEELGTITYEIFARKALEDLDKGKNIADNKIKAIKYLKKLDSIVPENKVEQRAEINYRLAELNFSSNMFLQQFKDCSKFYSKAFSYDNSYAKRKQWLLNLDILNYLNRSKFDLSEAIKEEKQNQLRDFFLNVDPFDMPLSEEDYLFCIHLASDIQPLDGNSYSQKISFFLKRIKNNTNSLIVLDALYYYYPSSANDTRIELNRRIDGFPSTNSKRKTLSTVTESEQIKKAGLLKKIFEHEEESAANHLALAESYKSRNKKDLCLFHFSSAYRLAGDLVENNTQSEHLKEYLGFSDDVSIDDPNPPVFPSVKDNFIYYTGPDIRFKVLVQNLKKLNKRLGQEVEERYQYHSAYEANEWVNKTSEIELHDGKKALVHPMLRHGETLEEIIWGSKRFKYSGYVKFVYIKKLNINEERVIALNHINGGKTNYHPNTLLILKTGKNTIIEDVDEDISIDQAFAKLENKLKKNLDKKLLRQLNIVPKPVKIQGQNSINKRAWIIEDGEVSAIKK